MQKLKQKTKSLLIHLGYTTKYLVETVIVIFSLLGVTVLNGLKLLYKKTMDYIKWVQSKRRKDKEGNYVFDEDDVDSGKSIIAKTVLMILVFGFFLYLLGVAFKQHVEARLDFKPELAQNEATLSFNPEVDTNIAKKISTGLERKKLVREDIFFTSYNPVVGQTDNSPCIGASGKDQCYYAKQGLRMLALSQDLVGRNGDKPFVYGDTVYLLPKDELVDNRCRGEFMVVDTMNKRYINRGDLFFMDSKDNTSCYVDIYKLD
jgi:hypothetical protein